MCIDCRRYSFLGMFRGLTVWQRREGALVRLARVIAAVVVWQPLQELRSELSDSVRRGDVSEGSGVAVSCAVSGFAAIAQQCRLRFELACHIATD
jgi:hypothetical protein